MHTLVLGLVEIHWTIKLRYFNQYNPPFLDILSIVFTGSPLVALKRRTKLLQMLGVTTIGSHSHVGTQALGEVRHRLVDVFLWQLSPDGLPGNFQLISQRLQLEFTVLFQYGTSGVIVQHSSEFKSGELEGHSVFSMNPFAFSQFCMTLRH